tara:strand:- start:191 stop:475 length:285 start_codon:yes stop_codon:yes gene_type:complete
MRTSYLNTTKNLRIEHNSGIDIYYSYSTPVAFRQHSAKVRSDLNGVLWVSKNVWSRTTGKHLTKIDDGDKDSRIEHDLFLKLFARAKKEVGYDS